MVKRIFLWLLGIVLTLAVLTVLAFQFSPWPSVAIIQYVFSQGDRSSEAALERHVPADVSTRRDLPYRAGPDEIFDLNYPTNVPTNAEGPLPTIVWIHGGAWIAGSKDGIANYLKVLAGRGYTTVGVEYSTGFGSTYPKPVEQVNAALAYLVDHAEEFRIDPNAIVLAGDSAGAQIAAQVALIVTDPSYAQGMGIAPSLQPSQLDAVLLLSGAYDIATVDFDDSYGWFLKTVLWAYSGTRNFLNDERFRLGSVTEYVTASFPPSFISSGNGDPLAPQAVTLARKLEELGVEVDSLFFPADYSPKLPHEYQFNLDIDAGQQALDRMIGFVESKTQSASQ